jgi:plasmid stability protein
MPDVLIRNMPTDLYEKLKQRAQRDRRSIPAENVHLLERLFEHEETLEQHRQTMQRIIERAQDKEPLPVDSLTLLREDRER